MKLLLGAACCLLRLLRGAVSSCWHSWEVLWAHTGSSNEAGLMQTVLCSQLSLM